MFDVYEGDNLGAGKKSYSVSFLLQDPTQTLTDQAIDAVMNRLHPAVRAAGRGGYPAVNWRIVASFSLLQFFVFQLVVAGWFY